MTARHHHYLSQCYLKGFTEGGKKPKLTVVDFKEKKLFKTRPRNVGGLRDFNRFEIEGVDPNYIETSLANFEGRAATALKNVGKSFELKCEDKDYILNLIALFAIRSPEQREHKRQIYAQEVEKITALSLATKERWESQISRMKSDGYEAGEDISYEECKAFFESKAYTIEVARERHIITEINQIEAILPYLYGRNWLLIKSTEESGPFITTDNPVNLTWNEPEKIPPLLRNSPGFGLKNTQVYFPLSRNIALQGEFEGKEGLIQGTKELVAVLNTKMLMFTYKQVYAPQIGFYVIGREGKILDGSGVLKEIKLTS